MRIPEGDSLTFKESIELNKPMTPQEATEKLAIFHGTSNDAVLAAFGKLRGFESETVEFKHSRNNGTPCISMDGKTSDGNIAWWHLIDRSTGQPMMRIS